MVCNGVITTLTGNLVRAGFCDFQNDGQFNSLLETYKTNVPYPPKTKNDSTYTQYHRYNGASWVLITK